MAMAKLERSFAIARGLDHKSLAPESADQDGTDAVVVVHNQHVDIGARGGDSVGLNFNHGQ